MTTATISSLVLRVFEKGSSTENTAIYMDSSLTVGGTFFDTLQTDDYWDVDDIGYNFRHTLTQTDLAASSVTLEGGKKYRLEYRIVTSSFGVVWVIAEYVMEAVLTE